MAKTPRRTIIRPEAANRVRQYRLLKRIPARRLAEAVGISPAYLYDIERYQSVPTVYVAFRIAQALGEPVEEVFPPIPGLTIPE